jgi:F0F1-type ATP synthase assembly protein I
MSDANPEDTGQISVAELLARNGQKTNLTAGGRRRRGVKGGISVAELTGEIPVVRDEPGDRSAPVVDEPQDEAPDTAANEPKSSASDGNTTAASTPQPARPQSTRPTPYQPAGKRDKQQPEPELLSGSTTVAGDLLNRSHDDTARGLRPAAPAAQGSERRPYGATQAEQGRARRSAGFQPPRSTESAEPKTDVTSRASLVESPHAALVEVDDLAKTAVTPRITRGNETADKKIADEKTTDESADEAGTQVIPEVVDLTKPATDDDPADSTTADPKTADTASTGSRADRRKSASKDQASKDTASKDTASTDKSPVKGKGGAVRQWLVLIGQAVVSIVVGALLFKGFEQLWDVLPWVALVLSVLVIVGLVAVVRILRRTDDLVSIVIAIAVGVFVTLGPLAFQLSTG